MQSKNSYHILRVERLKEEKAKRQRVFEPSSLQAFKPLFLLHGLFDCSLSWKPIADQLSDRFDVHLLPLRNHRDAKRYPSMSFDEMADDIKKYADENKIGKFYLVGHSLGGKTAMRFAQKYPQMLEKFVAVDISPCRGNSLVEYNAIITNLLNQVLALKNLPLSDYHCLSDFAAGIKDFDDDTKRAIIGNINFDGQKFSWFLNIDAIFNNFDKLTGGFEVDDFINSKINVPVLFIKAENSEFLPKSDFKAIEYIFPNSGIVEISGCTHRIHLEKPQILSDEIRKFLSK